MPMDVLLGKPPKMHRDVRAVAARAARRSTCRHRSAAAAIAVLAHPTVASKRFLITIGDRTVAA
jgi:phosphoribosylformylglycinamidine synthase